jgi:asparagine synthase (glutamine-hydrolysing)
MCGICGQFNFGDAGPVLRGDIDRMTSTLVHRGPDDQGSYIAGPVGLGFRRLSIIDLEGGHQPMSNQDESVWVVFNGEIYNFPELRRELEGLGYVFRTNCDTEVIVHGYRQWGEEVLNRLNGMFGLAIWDVLQRRLVVARDRYGIKLIYYKVDGGSVYFGSEMRPVLAAADSTPAVDANALQLFLKYRFTPSPYTMYQGIRKLAPGTLLRCENGTCKVRRWYTYKPTLFSPPKTAAGAEAELLDLYRQSVKRHLLSDVPVGLLLSGGLDSGLLLALMNLYGSAWRTYTVGYGSGFADDELVDAADTARRFSAQHTAVRLDQASFEEALPKIVSWMEEPIASSSVVPMYFVCERARQDVKVALIGQGPDELFGGYRRHLGVQYGAWWSALPGWVRTPASAAIRALPRNEALKRGTYAFQGPDRFRRYQQVLALLPGGRMDELFRDGVVDRPAEDAMVECWSDLAELTAESDELGGFQFMELRSTLPDELLMYADKLSMAHGLEARVPYLDRDIVEYVERLPSKFKVRLFSQKWLHRRVCESFLPREILNRKKRGFAVNVVDGWLRGATGKRLMGVLRDSHSHLYEYLRPAAVEKILQEHQSGHNDNHKVLFSLVVLEEWLRSTRAVCGAPAVV